MAVEFWNPKREVDFWLVCGRNKCVNGLGNWKPDLFVDPLTISSALPCAMTGNKGFRIWKRSRESLIILNFNIQDHTNNIPHSFGGDTDFCDIITGTLHRDTLAPFWFILLIIIIIIIMLCQRHGYPWPSFATSPSKKHWSLCELFCSLSLWN